MPIRTFMVIIPVGTDTPLVGESAVKISDPYLGNSLPAPVELLNWSVQSEQTVSIDAGSGSGVSAGSCSTT